MPKLIPNAVWDAILSERDFLRALVSKEREHVQRLERAAASLPEVAPEGRKATPMPDALRAIVEDIAPGEIRSRFIAELNARYRVCGDWGVVMDEVIEKGEGLE